MTRAPEGPFIVWTDYGYEGWQPTSYPTLLDAVTKGGITESHVITYRIDLARYLCGPNIAPAPNEPKEGEKA